MPLLRGVAGPERLIRQDVHKRVNLILRLPNPVVLLSRALVELGKGTFQKKRLDKPEVIEMRHAKHKVVHDKDDVLQRVKVLEP